MDAGQSYFMVISGRHGFDPPGRKVRYDRGTWGEWVGVKFFEQDVPETTTLLHFRHLLEEHGIGKLMFDAINRCLERTGRVMRGGGRLRPYGGGHARQCP